MKETPGSYEQRVDRLVRAYREGGHRAAALDPLGRSRPVAPDLDPAFFGLGEEDMDQHLSSRTVEGLQNATLQRVLQRLRNTYCRSIGVEFIRRSTSTCYAGKCGAFGGSR